MRKFYLVMVGLAIAFTTSFGQAINDYAVIPMSVTLNSILRLDVKSGGNIEFVVNTMQDYASGVANTPKYDTKFTVASSIDFKVTMATEDPAFLASDGSASLALNYVDYQMEETGTGSSGAANDWVLLNELAANVLLPTQDIITSNAQSGAGDGAKNAFTIHWSLGQTNNLLTTAGNLSGDHYSTNIYLTLAAIP